MDFLLVDEVSVVGRKLLVSIHKALCIAKDNDLPFRGVNIIFARDFAQLPPVGQHSLYSRSKGCNVSNLNVQADVFRRFLWLSVNVVILLMQLMQQSDEVNCFVNLLTHLHVGKCNNKDDCLLQSRLLSTVQLSWENEAWLDAPIIVTGNVAKDMLNERAMLTFAQWSGRLVHWYKATDCVDGGCHIHARSSDLVHTCSRPNPDPY